MSSLQQVSTSPITDIDFQGLHWIEASAGSGKTYTLSSLMVRILIEKYVPRQIIATTFTRAAAAELKVRIRKRLIEVQAFFELRLSEEHTSEHNLQYAQTLKNEDPLKAILLHHFADQVAYACERLRFVLEQLDELFVGTLDSFSQKLLREFAFESGKTEPADITDDAKRYTHQIIHDVLREWIQSQPQTQVDWLYRAGCIGSVESYIKLVEDSLNFSNAILQVPQHPKINLEAFENVLNELKMLSLTGRIQELADYYQLDGKAYKVVDKRSFQKDKFHFIFTQDLPILMAQIHAKGTGIFFKSNSFTALDALFVKSNGELRETVFGSKCDEQTHTFFYQHPVIVCLKKLYDEKEKLKHALTGLEAYLKFHLCEQVKIRLPQLLQQKSETTFSQQIRTLAEALQGEQGQLFAAFVQKRYPLILVDEFQDTNQDQDDVLATIWRHSRRYQDGCMIMVGDRKQAIYGFRGGDMLTFLKAEQDVAKKQGRFYRLQYNHRSIAPLVEVVDALFLRETNFGEGVDYAPVQAGTRPHPPLMDHHVENPIPLRWLHLNQDVSEFQQVAWKISLLLQQSQKGELYLKKDHQNIEIVEDDIAVLSKNHHGLDQVQYALERLGVRVNRPAKRSVFDSSIAQDVAAVLTAIMHPFDEAKVKRALLSRMLNINLKQLQGLEQQTDGLSQYIQQFDEIREMWFERNFLSAWQYCLKVFDVWKNVVASKSRDNERVVVNLRHLSDVLSQHSSRYQGPQNLYQWYLKQLSSPSEREWELERKLSSAAGVQLMTIHQSKGLEFKIVFLLNADGTFKEPNKTLNYSSVEQMNELTQQNEKKRVIAVHDKETLKPEDLQQHQERAEAEQHRVWYVALTRASHRVYAVLGDEKGVSNTGLGFWKNREPYFEHPFSGVEPLILQEPPAYKEKKAEITEIQAAPLPNKRFYPRLKTSFTALAQHLSHQQASDLLAQQSQTEFGADDESMENDELSTVENISPNQKKINWINRTFPKGKQAGNFLHEIFEHLDFQDTSLWSLEISRRFKNDYSGLQQQLLQQYEQKEVENPETQMIEDVKLWLEAIMTTPLHHNFSLSVLKQGHYLSEFPFYLAMSDQVFAVQRVQALLKEYEIDIPEPFRAEAARFLTGAIDLVYEHAGQFFIADYKSNFLGEMQEHYSTKAIQNNMTTSSYWLQASLYLVALHRYLKKRLAHYNIDQHLGGATYLYLRGMNGQAQTGLCYWRPESEFILRLDAVFGYFDGT